MAAAVFEIATQQVADTEGKYGYESRIRNMTRAAGSSSVIFKISLPTGTEAPLKHC